MSHLIVFACGITIGVMFDKVILAWKSKAMKAANAAKDALKE